MTFTRRKVIKTAGALGAATLILPSWACKEKATTPDLSDENSDSTPTPSLTSFGLQLYTLRDIIGADPKAVLKNVSEYGYKEIESYEGDQGMFWGMKNTEFKSYLDELNMSMVSSHCNMNQDFERKAAEMAEIGGKYLICPWIGPQKTLDEYKKQTDRFNECGKICKANGIRFAYHNHAYSFVELEGQIPQDYMMDNSDPDSVDFEMDIYWVIVANVDPIGYFAKYPNRFKLCHVKDRSKNASPEDQEASCDLGTGAINFPQILASAKSAGMEHYILEQEKYENSSPLGCAKVGADYLSKIVFES
jgi:sugar phosphate isomerase/epimerase